MPQEPEKIKKLGKKVVANQGSTPLAILADTTDIIEKADSIEEQIKALPELIQALKEAFPEYDDTSIKEQLTDLSEELKKKEFFDQETFDEVVSEVLSRTPKPTDGKTPTRTELEALIKPLIPAPLPALYPSENELIDLFLPFLPDPILPLSAIEIRDNLETLEENERLDWKAIKGYESFEKDILDRAVSILDSRTSYLINKVNNLGNTSGGVAGSGTVNELTYWVDSTTLGSLTTATYPSLTELSYVKGVTSSIQTQLNSKLSSAVTSLNSPSATITLSASTGAVDADVNQASGYSWSGDHIFTSNIDFTPVDSTSQFFDMNPDSSASLPSRLRFWTSGSIMSSLEVNVDQSKDIRYLLPKDQPTTGQILYVSDWTDPVATLNWTTAAGDVVGPASAASNEMTIFDGSTGKWIQGITAVSAGTLVTIGTNSVIYPNENVISIGTVSSTYTGSFSGSTNGANGLDIYNSNVGTSKITQVLLRSGSTTGADTYGKILAYPTNYSNAALAARFVIEAGTSQQFVFQTDSNFEWRQNTTPTAKLTTAGFLSGNGSPLAQLHALQGTLGSDVLRIESVATNDDVRQSTYQNRVATTTNTQTTIHTFTLATTTTYLIEARVTARRTGGSAGTAEDSAGYVIRGTYKNVAGTATLVGTLDTPYTAEDQAGWNATFTVTGATVLCRVTGATNNNITWHMTATVNQLTS